MTDMQTCTSCSTTKPLDAYERLSSGGHRGTCIACRRAASNERKRLATVARRASPEYLARIAQLKADRETRKASKEAAEAAIRAEQAAMQEARREAVRREREERAASLRDDIWDAMRRGRASRAVTAVAPQRTALHPIKLRHGEGYISTSELACRCAEREAAYRAARVCKTFEAAAGAACILEQSASAIERIKELRALWVGEPQPQAALQGLLGTELEDEGDPFGDALGDWAPPWMRQERGSWTTSLNL